MTRTFKEMTIIKFLALALCIVLAMLALYTVVIGVRLGFASFCIRDCTEWAGAGADITHQTYRDMNELRASVASETWYAGIICSAGNVVRIAILAVEVTLSVLCGMLYTLVANVQRAYRRRTSGARHNSVVANCTKTSGR